MTLLVTEENNLGSTIQRYEDHCYDGLNQYYNIEACKGDFWRFSGVSTLSYLDPATVEEYFEVEEKYNSLAKEFIRVHDIN